MRTGASAWYCDKDPRKYPILKRIEYDTCMPERTVVKLCRWPDVDRAKLASMQDAWG